MGRVTLKELAEMAAEREASDIFFKVGAPPTLRIHGDIVPLTQYRLLEPEDTRKVAYSIMTEEQIARFEKEHEMDCAFELPGIARFRVNIYQQRGTAAVVMRLIPLKIRSIEELNLPPVLKEIATRYRDGLVLVTGRTGCGKTTTLAAMLDLINSTRRCHIVTIEEPIEYVHRDKLAIVSQREVGLDTDSFLKAMRRVVRESPDIILIGEMRDLETFQACMQAAETGHLVFSTLHTSSAHETVERIINMFQPHERHQICLQLSQVLRGVVSQRLVKRADGKGRLPAVEIMINTPTVAKMVQEQRIGDIYHAIAEGGFWGMQTLNQALDRYCKQGFVTEEEALANAGNVAELKHMLRQPPAKPRAAEPSTRGRA